MSTLFSRISQKGKKAIFEERFANASSKIRLKDMSPQSKIKCKDPEDK